MIFKTIDLKEFKPTVELALYEVEKEIELAKASNVFAIKVVHGYGSHGVGGTIFSALRQKLKNLKKQGKIYDFLNGEDWNIFNPKAKLVLEKCDMASLDSDLNKNNPGITVILIK